jgi:hypothetical protein
MNFETCGQKERQSRQIVGPFRIGASFDGGKLSASDVGKPVLGKKSAPANV